MYVSVIRGSIIIVVFITSPVVRVGGVSWEEDGAGGVAGAANYGVSPEPGRWSNHRSKLLLDHTKPVIMKLIL